MPTNKVNNNIKLKSGGGLVNDATDGFGLKAGDILPAMNCENLVGLFKKATLSDNAILSSLTEVSTTSESQIILKSVNVYFGGNYRIKFQIKRGNNSYTSSYTVSVNGVVKSSFNAASDVYENKVIDLTDVPAGAIITLSGSCSSGRAAFAKDFTTCCDYTLLTVPGYVIL